MARGRMPPDTDWIDLGGGHFVRGTGVRARLIDSAPRAAVSTRRRGLRSRRPDALAEAFAATDMRTVTRFEIERAPMAPPPGRRGLAVRAPAAAHVEVVVPAPPAGFGQVLLAIDELGVATWHLARKAPPAPGRRGLRGRAGKRYRLTLSGGTGGARRRGLVSTVARKAVQVLLFPITDPVLGPIEHLIAKVWEARHVPYVVRTFTSDNYATRLDRPLTSAEWRAVAAGPALLFVHGTFSSAHGAFSLLPARDMRAIQGAYDGRVFAFNHPTLGDDPKQNAAAFCRAIPDGVTLELDIVCHSRGGLVARALANAANELGGRDRVKVRRIVFVAPPNDGTVLADAANMTHMLDRYLAVTRFVPDGPAQVAIDLVVTAVKALASAGLRGLPGLAAQAPDSAFLEWLRSKRRGAAEYYGVSADYEPSSPEWKRLLLETVEDAVMDEVFGQEPNDLVVPTLGVGERVHGPGFPIPRERELRVPSGSDVMHTNMFGDPEIVATIRGWLGAGPASATISARRRRDRHILRGASLRGPR